MAASALLSPVRPLAGTTLSFGVPYQNKRRIPTMRVYCAADEEEEVNDLGVNVALSMLKFYKREISPLLPSSCRYVPTCSQYSMQAYKKYGVAKGTILTAWRLCHCNPLGVRLYIRKDSIAYCLPMQLSQARVFRSSTAPDKGNLFVYSSIDSCHVEKQPLPVLSQQKVLVMVLVHLVPDCINDIWSQFQLLHACTVVPGLPLFVLLRALHQVCTLTGDGVEGVRPQNVLLQRQPQPTIPWGGRVQYVKQSREGGTIAIIGDALDEHVWLHLADVTEGNIPGVWPVAEDALVHQSTETPEVIHHKHLIRLDVQVLGTNCLPLCCCNSLESEWHTKLIGTAAQAMPCLLNTLKWTKRRLEDVNDGDPHLRRPVFPASQPAEQVWPVQPTARAVINYVQPLLPLHSLHDCHGGKHECHLREAAGCHVELVHLEIAGCLSPWPVHTGSAATHQFVQQLASTSLLCPCNRQGS
uniref:Membrane protein insertion efficiency factor YidD n=1 Tax=Oryza rufipogon TaxID=4529 RepID=A0A0E0RCD6_ORYRU